MGANGLAVGDRFPRHSDDYTTPRRTCTGHTRYLSNFPRTITSSWARNPIFFSSTVAGPSDSLSLSLSLSFSLRPSNRLSHRPSDRLSLSLSPSVRPLLSARRRVLISLITTRRTENNDTRRRRLLHTRSRTTNSSGGVRGASWCRARALLYLLRDSGAYIQRVCAHITIL